MKQNPSRQFGIVPPVQAWLRLIYCSFAAIAGCEPPPEEISRHNALREICPTDLSKLDSASRQKAVDYVTGWMNVFSVLGTHGISIENHLEQAYTKELLPGIQPLGDGTYLDRAAFKAGVKIYEAIAYLADRMRNKSPFENKELNALLRYEPGDENNHAKLSDGIGKLFFDYVQMVDENILRKAAAEAKKQGHPFSP